MHRLIGDTFLGWDYSGHVCRLGVRYFIERMDTNQWYAGRGRWSDDPHKCKVWVKKQAAEEYLKMSTIIPARLECQVTEHEFVQ